MKRFVCLLLLLALQLPWKAHADTIIVSGAVSGEDDTLISGPAYNSNFGGSSTLQVGSNQVNLGSDNIEEIDRSIIRFDLSSVANYTVLGASLQVTLASTTGDAFSNQVVYLYEISQANASWATDSGNIGTEFGSADWQSPAEDGGYTLWAGSAGLGTSGSDYATTPLGSITVNSSDAVGTVYTFNLADTSYFADWANNPGDNAGFLLVSPGLEALGDSSVAFDSVVAESDQPNLLVAVPEPGTGTLLAYYLSSLGFLALFRRRRGSGQGL